MKAVHYLALIALFFACLSVETCHAQEDDGDGEGAPSKKFNLVYTNEVTIGERDEKIMPKGRFIQTKFENWRDHDLALKNYKPALTQGMITQLVDSIPPVNRLRPFNRRPNRKKPLDLVEQVRLTPNPPPYRRPPSFNEMWPALADTNKAEGGASAPAAAAPAAEPDEKSLIGYELSMYHKRKRAQVLRQQRVARLHAARAQGHRSVAGYQHSRQALIKAAAAAAKWKKLQLQKLRQKRLQQRRRKQRAAWSRQEAPMPHLDGY